MSMLSPVLCFLRQTFSRQKIVSGLLGLLAFSGTALALPVAAVSPAQTSSPTANMLQVVLGLVLVLGLMAGAAWLLKRLSAAHTPAGHAIKIIGGVAVGNRERVMVVEVADQWIVVGVAPGSVNALATLPRQILPESSATAVTSGGNFSSWLKQKIDQRNAQ